MPAKTKQTTTPKAKDPVRVRQRGYDILQAYKRAAPGSREAREALEEAGHFWLKHGGDIMHVLHETYGQATRQKRATNLKKFLVWDLELIAERLEEEGLA